MSAAKQIMFDFGDPPEEKAEAPVATSLPETPPVAEKETAAPVVEAQAEMQPAIEAPEADDMEPEPLPAMARKKKAEALPASAPVLAAPVRSTRGRKSIKEMEASAALVNVPEDEELFSKQYYAISEVAAMFQVNTSLIRFWETEFDVLKPRKNRKGDRFFRPQDIRQLQLIHFLLRQKKYTIEGAKTFMKKNKGKAEVVFEMVQSLQSLKSFLLELKANL